MLKLLKKLLPAKQPIFTDRERALCEDEIEELRKALKKKDRLIVRLKKRVKKLEGK